MCYVGAFVVCIVIIFVIYGTVGIFGKNDSHVLGDQEVISFSLHVAVCSY